MADNVTLNQNTTSGAIIATDDVGGAQHQYVKVEFGADGVATPVDASNPLPVAGVVDIGNTVDVTGSTVAISGTVPVSAAALPLPTGAATAALQTQPGVDIGDVTINNAAGASAVNIQDGGNSITVDGTVAISGTVPISAVALPLPSGAATAAKQPALGTAGIPSADVLSVQGVASMTALKVDGSAVTQPVSGTVTANAGSGTFAISAAALPLPSGAATSALQTQPGVDIGDVTVNNATGAAAVNIQDGGNSITVDATALPLPTGASTAAKQPALGTAGTASADVITVQGIASMTALKVDGSAVTQPVSGTVTASNTTGNVANDGVDSGNPVKIGTKAANALPAAVANADRVDAIGDLFGRQLIAHIDPAMQVWKSANYTTTQTGATIWDPTSGKKIAITSIVVGAYGATAARLILWFGANGDTTYTAGTDQLVWAASFAPAATGYPGLVFTPATPVFCITADNELHITTDANLSVDIAVYGYEWV